MIEHDGRAPQAGKETREIGTYFVTIADDASTFARVGVLTTRQGAIQTPAFMPVGTQASIKSLTPAEVRDTGAEVILANTYHLMLRPGVEVIRAAGGLHVFMGWSGPILTDSGGFQVFSLAPVRKIEEAGVTFRSPIDGSSHQLTPERAIDLQLAFGSDIIMPLDDVTGFDAEDCRQHEAMERTHRWLGRAVEHFGEHVPDAPSGRPLLFGIAQGGFSAERRRESAEVVARLPVDGLAIGGLSVGEPKDLMAELLEATISTLPADRPRYLMGVGSPEDLWNCVAAGVDMFDCVHPTRVARRGALFTPDGRVNVTTSRFRNHHGPVDPDCDCLTCQSFSTAYLHHLFRAHELLAYRLASIHNLRFMQRQMTVIRATIVDGTFEQAKRTFLLRYRPAKPSPNAARRKRRDHALDSADRKGRKRRDHALDSADRKAG